MFGCAGLALWALRNYTVGKLSQPQHEPSLIWLLAGGTIICQHFTQWEVSSRSLERGLPLPHNPVSSVQRADFHCFHSNLSIHWSLRIPWPMSNAWPEAGMALHRSCLGGDAPHCPFPSKRQCNHTQTSRDAEQASKHDIQSHTETFLLNCQAEAGRI